MTKQINEISFLEALDKSIKEELRFGGWPVYRNYEIEEENGEVFVVAPFVLSFKPEPVQEGLVDQAGTAQRRWRLFEANDPIEDLMSSYPPLRTPELVVELAALADKEITPEDVVSWAEVYGLLGFPEDDVIEAKGAPAPYHLKGQGRRDNVTRFAMAAEEIRTCLGTYEFVTAAEGPLDLEALEAYTKPFPTRTMWKALRPSERHDGEERRWVLQVIGRMVQTRISEHCYPKLSHYPDGRFALSYGFKNLLGALWLQMALLLAARDRPRTCKLPSCPKVITFEPGEEPADSSLRKNVRGKYATRRDKVFCGHNHAALYSYRKKAGWPGYI